MIYTQDSTADIGFYIKKINDAFEKRLNRDLKPLGITSSQMSFLLILAKQTAMPMKELQNQLQVSQPTIAGITARLLGKELIGVTVDPNDHRNKIVHLTPAGRQLTIQLSKKQQTAEAVIKNSFGTEDYMTFVSLLKQMLMNLNEMK